MIICLGCLKETQVGIIDHGFSYDYGSESGFFHDTEEVSHCCWEKTFSVTPWGAELMQRYYRRYGKLLEDESRYQHNGRKNA